jgi:anti-sigma B factor antagonist
MGLPCAGRDDLFRRAPEVMTVPDPADTVDFLDTTITRPHPGTAVLAVQGEIDTLTAPAFSVATTELVTGPDETLVIDLTGVRFLASSGLAVLITAAHRAEERGARLRLVVSTRSVRRPLEITGTHQLFEVHPDLNTAIAHSD